VNRISLGIQTLNEKTLQSLGRSHDLKDIWDSIETIQKIPQFRDLSRVSFDLIMGLPHETLNDWNNTLKDILKLNPGHLSIYFLTIEQNTVFGTKLKYKEGSLPLPNMQELEDMYNSTCAEMQRNGYHHYEVSSFAKNNHTKAVHNGVYWKGDEPFFGFGMGAASFMDRQRFTRPKTLKQYQRWVESLKENYGGLVDLSCEKEEKGSLEWLKSVVMGKLRTSEGVNVEEIAETMGVDYDEFVRKMKEFVEPYVDLGWVKLEKDSFGRYVMEMNTTKGFLFSDEFTSRLFLCFENMKGLRRNDESNKGKYVN